MTKPVTKKVIWDPEKKANHLPFEVTSENFHLTPLSYVPQTGPQCGFAALSMVVSSAGITANPDDLVSKARRKGITNNGEMFSAQYMTLFAKEEYSQYFDVTLYSKSIKGLSYHFKEYFDDDNLILIPYDCDFNHEPCLKNGSTAHWAVLCGYVDGGNEDNFYVIACHGKSQFATPWSFLHLQMSNDNLNELGKKREADGNEYVIPRGGLKQNISSKWILFKRNPSEEMIYELVSSKWFVLGFGIGFFVNFCVNRKCPRKAESSPKKPKKGKTSDDPKMVLVVRKDLKLTKREIAVHVSRACLGAYKKALVEAPSIVESWCYEGSRKIALKVNSESELNSIQKNAEKQDIIHYLVKDAVPSKNTALILVVGPDDTEDVDLVTGHLKLY